MVGWLHARSALPHFVGTLAWHLESLQCKVVRLVNIMRLHDVLELY